MPPVAALDNRPVEAARGPQRAQARPVLLVANCSPPRQFLPCRRLRKPPRSSEASARRGISVPAQLRPWEWPRAEPVLLSAA